MRVDSFRFLPRSFRPLFDNPVPLRGEDEVVWAPFDKRLAEARIALLTSAGLYVKASQPPFDIERERREPAWGDPDWRRIPATVHTAAVGMTHLHVNSADILSDHNVALPTDVLGGLIDDGVVGAATDEHVSVMGYQHEELRDWRERTAPAIIGMLRDQGADGVVLAPV